MITEEVIKQAEEAPAPRKGKFNLCEQYQTIKPILQLAQMLLMVGRPKAARRIQAFMAALDAECKVSDV